MLQTQAGKLLTISETLGEWHRSKYGKFLRVCNQDTLQELRHMWFLYAQPLTKQVEECYKNGLDELKKKCNVFFGMGINSASTIFRAAGPLYLEALKQDFHNSMGPLFWKQGTTSIHPAEIKAATKPNLTMLYTRIGGDKVLICPSSNPLLSFHLPAAFAKLKTPIPSQKLPGRDGIRNPPLADVIDTCHWQFKSWCESFRKVLNLADQGIKNFPRIRFFIGDALAFCQTLGLYYEHREETFKEPTYAMFYTSSRRMTPLRLDGCDYQQEAILLAPRRFNVIETSNLTDHVGLLNLLLVAKPLLTKEHSSVIYTESFYRWKGTESQALDMALGGDTGMISVLLGIAPLPFICPGQTTNNYTAHASRTLEFLLHEYPGTDDVNTLSYQRYEWRYPSLGDSNGPDIRKTEWLYGPNKKSLARCLYEIHKVLFKPEERFLSGPAITPETPVSSQELIHLKSESVVHYTRHTYAHLIHLVKLKVGMRNWSRVIKELMTFLKADSCFPFACRFLPELETHLHLLDVNNISDPPSLPSSSDMRYLPGWGVMPSVVCVVLVVPRQALDVFANEQQALAGLYMQASVRNHNLNNSFAAIHTTFGEVHHNGRRGENLILSIHEDRSGWYGESDLIVAWMVPSWRLTLSHPSAITIALQLLLTPNATVQYRSKLGPVLDIYCTPLYGEGIVFVMEHLPGLISTKPISHLRYKVHNQIAPFTAHEEGWLQYTEIPVISSKSHNQKTPQLTIQTRNALPAVSGIDYQQVSPCSIKVFGTGSSYKETVVFPFPVDGSQASWKIFLSGTSEYLKVGLSFWLAHAHCFKALYTNYVACIQITAPISTTDGGYTETVTPVLLTRNSNTIVPWNLPRLYLDTLPALDMDDQANHVWLKRHARDMRGHRSLSRAPTSIVKNNPNPNTFLAISLGIHGPEPFSKPPKVFYLCCQSDITKGVLILQADVRLNPDSGTIVFDSCIVTNEAAFEIAFASQLGRYEVYEQLDCCEEMLEAWKKYLPAVTERCRTWAHTPATCEYTKGNIPISEPGMNPLCSCATGTFQADSHQLATWGLANMAGAANSIAMNGTRAATSPFFQGSWEDPEYGPCPDSRDNIKRARDPQELRSTTARCEVCLWFVDVADIMRCGGCEIVLYCCKKCQAKDWQLQHNKDCAKFRRMKEHYPEDLEMVLSIQRGIKGIDR